MWEVMDGVVVDVLVVGKETDDGDSSLSGSGFFGQKGAERRALWGQFPLFPLFGDANDYFGSFRSLARAKDQVTTATSPWDLATFLAFLLFMHLCCM